MAEPAVAPPVQVYAGDTTSFHSYTFLEANEPLDLIAAGWAGWLAQWRKGATYSAHITLTVNTDRAAEGIVSISCTATQSEEMAGDGVWDLQATRGAETRTFVRGTTRWTKDVSRA